MVLSLSYRDQDETDLVERAEDEALMGAVPLEQLSSDSTGAFARGELDVKEQMDRASREIEFPNRAGQKRPNLRA